MRDQAKKMNVTSLRADDDGGTRAEIKIAKVRAFFEPPSSIQSVLPDGYWRSIFLTEKALILSANIEYSPESRIKFGEICFMAKKRRIITEIEKKKKFLNKSFHLATPPYPIYCALCGTYSGFHSCHIHATHCN